MSKCGDFEYEIEELIFESPTSKTIKKRSRKSSENKSTASDKTKKIILSYDTPVFDLFASIKNEMQNIWGENTWTDSIGGTDRKNVIQMIMEALKKTIDDQQVDTTRNMASMTKWVLLLEQKLYEEYFIYKYQHYHSSVRNIMRNIDKVPKLMHLDPAYVATMSIAEFAGETEYIVPQTHKAEVIFQFKSDKVCNKCGEANVTYSELQNRSGDEGGTVFYTCNKCGNRMKNG